jgi:hypothetical protein
LLLQVRPEGLPAGAIAERLGGQPSLPSFHLTQLGHADLITQRRLSLQLIYSVSGSGVSMTALVMGGKLRTQHILSGFPPPVLGLHAIIQGCRKAEVEASLCRCLAPRGPADHHELPSVLAFDGYPQAGLPGE